MSKLTNIKAHTAPVGQAALEEARWEAVIRTARGKMSQTQLGRVALRFAQAEFDRHARLRGEYPQAYSQLFDRTVPPTGDKLRQQAHWKAATAAARREIEAILTRLEDTL